MCFLALNQDLNHHSQKVRSLTKRKYKKPNRAEDIIIGIKIHQKESAVDSDGTEEQISKLEDRVVEITASEQKKEFEKLKIL